MMPKFRPTPAQRDACMIMKAGGMTDAQIASVVDIDVKTLVKYLGKELKIGKAQVDARVMGTLATLASSGKCPAATFFWLKTRCGWKETANVELSVPDDTEQLREVILEVLNQYPEARIAVARRLLEIGRAMDSPRESIQ